MMSGRTLPRRAVLPLVAVLALAAGAAGAQSKPSWTQLSLGTCKVDQFLAQTPDSDGRGVVIAILDTGLDPSIPGLTRTPDGEVKVIDLQDFTGQGDVELHRIRLDPQAGKLIDYNDEGSPIAYTPPALPAAAPGEERRWWLGTFDEHRFINSGVSDLNDNGSTEDEWPVLVTALAGDGDDQAVCTVDTNLDRSFADEKPLRNYRLKFDLFTFRREAPEKETVPVSLAVNIFLRQEKVVIFWDDGAHGTHVAGIAAGYRINNQDGFNGVAPGAKLIGLKIGQNAIGGISVSDSIMDALRYAGRYAHEHNVPVVCNLSFGIESEIEGGSDIDKAMDEFLTANPYVVFCTSAGNEGPGLSSIGTPAAAKQVISVGAVLAADTARDEQAYGLDHAVPTTFTSRGGELDKPDVATPGWSTSTVPRYVTRGDYWAGTSMASPYAAGLCALLISDVIAPHVGTKVRAWDVRRALWLSGQPIPETTVLDVGWGVPDLPQAREFLKKLVPLAENDPVIGYDISTPCPNGYKGAARAAYWRGLWFPSDEQQMFTVSPIFAPSADVSARAAFTRKYELRSNSGWIHVPQQSVYLRSEQDARIYVEYDPGKLVEPGVYVGTVDGVTEAGLVAFRLWNTIVVPYRFSPVGDFTLALKDQVVDGWMPQRYMLAVPPGASALRLTLSAPEGEESKARLEYIFGPAGHGHRDREARLDTDTGQREVVRALTDELQPGVWEVDVVADRPDRQWPYELKAEFFGLHAEPRVIGEWSGGDKPSGELTVTNQFERRIVAGADGRVEGFRQHKEDEFEGLSGTLEYPIRLDERFDRVRLELEMTPEAFATMTDVGVELLDDSDTAVYSDAFSSRKLSGTFRKPGAGTVALKLVITAGFAVSDDQRKTPITVDIDALLAAPVAVQVTRDGESTLNLVPGVPIPLEYKVQERLPDAPAGTQPVGFLRLRERDSNTEVLRVPIEIEP